MKLYDVWSPTTGDHYEVSKPNYDDLTKNYGWSTSPIAIAAATAPAEPPVTPTAPAADETPIVPAPIADGAPAANAEETIAADAPTASSDEKADLIAALADKGITADKRKSVASLKAMLDEASA